MRQASVRASFPFSPFSAVLTESIPASIPRELLFPFAARNAIAFKRALTSLLRALPATLFGEEPEDGGGEAGRTGKKRDEERDTGRVRERVSKLTFFRQWVKPGRREIVSWSAGPVSPI